MTINIAISSIGDHASNPETVRNHFLVGLERVARVIDHNLDYDAIIGHKLTDEFRARFSPSFPIEERRRAALSEWQTIIAKSKQDTFALPDVDLLFLGRTKNNIREFSFFLDILGCLEKKFSHFNAVDLKLSRPEHSQNDRDQLVAQLMPAVVDYVSRRNNIGPELVYQLGQYAGHYIRYFFSLARKDSKRPLLAIVANDHSPHHVAFSMAMKTHKVARLYIQHAEVSHGFPPLDFEYSILRNEASRRIYAAIGPIDGDVFVISRCPGSSTLPKNLTEENGKQSVVLYTTARVEMDGLRLVAEHLRANDNVAAIYVKPHPSLAPLAWPSNVPTLEAIPSFPHVAVVANSSVVVELLQQGIPVFQNFDFDPVTADYYGFVKSGIAGTAPLEALSDRFWKEFSFDQQWYSRYTDSYAPPESDSERDKTELLAKMRCLLNQRVRPRASAAVEEVASKLPTYGKSILKVAAKLSSRVVLESVKYIVYESRLSQKAKFELGIGAPRREKIEWLINSLTDCRKPSDWFRSSLNAGVVDHEEAIKFIDQLYSDRHPLVFTLFDNLDKFEDSLPVYLWLSFKRFDITGVALPYPLEGMIDASSTIPKRSYVWSKLQGLAFNACLKQGRLDLLDLVLEKGLTFSTSRRVALLRHLISTGDVDRYEKFRKEFWRAESPFNRLKIVDLDNSFGTKHDAATHEETESAFEANAPKPIAVEFKAEIKPIYDRIRTSMRFMDVRSSSKERDLFQQLVVQALQNRNPFSMIRLSDGEGYAFADNHEYFTLNDQLIRERHWWGMELDPAVRSAITGRVRAAVDRADILGVPSIHRFVRDIHGKSSTFKAGVPGRGLLQVLHHFSDKQTTALFGEEKMNLPLFRSPNLVREILSASEDCILVSSANTNHLPEWMHQFTNVSHITIPTHFRTSRNGKYHSADTALPLVYEAIDQEIRTRTSSGTLVLVAGGIIGKIFVGTAQEAGGVALDLGSIVDEWLASGIQSTH